MRIFVALNLPEPVRDRLCAAVRPLTRIAGVRAIACDALHLTLHFIGHVEEPRVDVAADCVARAVRSATAFPLQLSDMGAFPNVRRPRVWWVGVSSPPELLGLQQDVEAGLAAEGFRTEERTFHPHLTVGRVRETASRADLTAMAEAAAAFAFSESFRVESVELMRSELRRDGARYSVVRSWPLPGGRA